MWEVIGNWLTKRFSSPLPVLFFLLGTVLIIIEAIEVKLPDGTQVLRANEFGQFISYRGCNTPPLCGVSKKAVIVL